MTNYSVLFQTPTEQAPDEPTTGPDFFVDLNLDQIVSAITAGKEEYNLTPFFWMALQNVDDTTFRHEVMRDLEDAALLDTIRTFAQSMRRIREHRARVEKRGYPLQQQRWFLDAVDVYCDAISRLLDGLCSKSVKSRGLVAIREYLGRYVETEGFVSLLRQSKELKGELSAIRYSVLIRGLRVEVRHYEGEPNYSDTIHRTFERFSQGEVEKVTFRFDDSTEINHVEGQILDLVAHLYAETFSKLAGYFTLNQSFVDPIMIAFDREIQFYVAYLEYVTRFKKSGLSVCYPRVSQTDRQVRASECFDLALAGKITGGDGAIVTNDFVLKDPERIFVVSGPNQGGKTTFARTIGQMHYLASLGCLVPGTEAYLYLPDKLFTHFERQEQMSDLRGKLQDDLVRMHEILEAATPRSIIIINEMFSSTTLQDAVFLSRKIAGAIVELDALSVWVTFIDEVSSFSPKMVSMVSMVAPGNAALRTFKVIRKPADGLAYAASIAEKYGLTYDAIKERMGQ